MLCQAGILEHVIVMSIIAFVLPNAVCCQLMSHPPAAYLPPKSELLSVSNLANQKVLGGRAAHPRPLNCHLRQTLTNTLCIQTLKLILCIFHSVVLSFKFKF